MSFLDHLEELRWHLIRSIVSILVFAIIAFLAKDIVWDMIILGPSRPDFWTYQTLCKIGDRIGSKVLCIEELPFIIQSRQMTGQFTMHILSSLVIGLLCAFPYTFWEVWRFIRPGLYDTEQKVSRGATFFVSLLFLSGVGFGYFIVTPLAVNFLANYQVASSIQNEFDIISYVTTVATLVLTCGLMFQLPIVVFFLSKAGLVTPQLMRSYRRHAIIVILLISAVLTPPDVISQVLIAFPLAFLYQISIFISGLVIRRAESQTE
ncbi:MAG: twin-arginine translocase subunit TatC [Cyclobacteriaceae bacterium]|nr:twin-arginine translocase subunit TatC [Cyclobacteriaceae bacterium]